MRFVGCVCYVRSFPDYVLQIAQAFEGNIDGFRAYSDCCANYSTALEVLGSGQNVELQAFLDARNPSCELSSAVQSYLIKPVQRILKYPLLLREMMYVRENTSPTPYLMHACFLADHE